MQKYLLDSSTLKQDIVLQNKLVSINPLVTKVLDKKVLKKYLAVDTISHTPPEPYLMCAVLWIQLILMRIRIRHFTLIRIRIQALSSKN